MNIDFGIENIIKKKQVRAPDDAKNLNIDKKITAICIKDILLLKHLKFRFG